MNTATSKLTILRRSLALAGALAALSVAPISFATAQSEDVPSVTVRYADLDLGSAAGVNTLYHRISNAAKAVCPNPDIRDLNALTAAEHCQDQAIARAVQQVNNPKLAVVHAARISHG